MDNKFNDSRIIENTAHVDFNDKNLNIVRSIQVNSFPILREQLTPEIYVHQAISNGVNESSFLRLDPDEKSKLYDRGSILLISTLTSPKTRIEIPTKNYVDYEFDDPGVKKTLLMLTSMMKILIMLDSLK